MQKHAFLLSLSLHLSIHPHSTTRKSKEERGPTPRDLVSSTYLLEKLVHDAEEGLDAGVDAHVVGGAACPDTIND